MGVFCLKIMPKLLSVIENATVETTKNMSIDLICTGACLKARRGLSRNSNVEIISRTKFSKEANNDIIPL